MNNRITKQMIYDVARKYGLTTTIPSITTSELEEITANLVEKCRPQLEAADASERASYQLAWQIQTN